MSEAVLLAITISIALLCIVLIVVTFLYARNTRAKLLQSVGLISDLHTNQQKLAERFKGLENKLENEKPSDNSDENAELLIDVKEQLSVLQKQVTHHDNRLDELYQQDPELKLYTKANKLLAAGEDIEDVIEASGLPRAEVEMLFDIHRRR